MTNASLDVITVGLAWSLAVLAGQALGLTHPGGNMQGGASDEVLGGM